MASVNVSDVHNEDACAAGLKSSIESRPQAGLVVIAADDLRIGGRGGGAIGRQDFASPVDDFVRFRTITDQIAQAKNPVIFAASVFRTAVRASLLEWMSLRMR